MGYGLFQTSTKALMVPFEDWTEARDWMEKNYPKSKPIFSLESGWDEMADLIVFVYWIGEESFYVAPIPELKL